MQIIQVQQTGDVYSCDIGISKEEWLKILQDSETSDNFKDALLRFYYMPGHKGSCTAVSNTIGGNANALNILVSKFGSYVKKKLGNRFDVRGTDGQSSRWIIPMNNGRRLPNGSEGTFEWELRPELVEALSEYLYWYLVECYKEVRKEIPINDSKWEELYKWQLVTVSKGKTPFEIVRDHITHPGKAAMGGFENLIDAARDNKALKHLLKNNATELQTILEKLTDETLPLNNRLADYKAAMANLLPATGFNSKANDERTASVILTCVNPHKYTIYKYDVYKQFCKYHGVSYKPTGQCFEHFLELLLPLSEVAKKDDDLQQLIMPSLEGKMKSDLLLAQDILWILFVQFPQRLGYIQSLINKKNKEDNYSEKKMESKYLKYIDLLEKNKNLILTGAPGTGKTFMAKEIAKEFITNTISRYKDYNDDYWKATRNCFVLSKIIDTQVVMVQFHPSYDYTDFVEGLRPIKNEDGQIGFRHFDGVFKLLCKNPHNRFVVRKITNTPDNSNSLVSSLGDLYYDCYKAVIEDILAGYVCWSYFAEAVPESVISRYNYFSIEFKEHEDDKDCIVDNETTWVDYPDFSSKLFCNVTQSYDNIFNNHYPSIESIKNNLIEIWSRQSSEEMWKNRNSTFNVEHITPSCPISNIDRVADFYYTLFYWIIDYASVNYKREYLPSVFIIDEINRGEISKIFGELFFSIDPGYRGENGKVNTQYQNMIEEGDVFKDGFFVPENVYIIGTMNDIDRSVESMDFAMRRRFAFEEVTAEESYANMIENEPEFAAVKDEIKGRMFNLNKAIAETEGLNEAYQIGAAYFRKYLDYADREQPFDCLWNNHLKGLLFEYLRGNRKAKELLEKLHKAYNTTSADEQATHTDEG